MPIRKPNQGPQNEGPEIPPDPSFRHLVDTFAVPALIWTGHLKNPGDEQVEPNLELAQFQIGLLEILAQKTQGNLEPPEEEYLATILHNVRLAFVRTAEALGIRPPGGVQPQEPPRQAPPPPTAPEEPKSDDDDDRPGLRWSKKYEI